MSDKLEAGVPSSGSFVIYLIYGGLLKDIVAVLRNLMPVDCTHG